jgi:DNA adenine methylase
MTEYKRRTRPRPVLRWHGGKFNLAPWIISHFPSHRAYVEPFGGAASVLMRKPKSKAEVYNDLDGQVANLFRVLRDHGDELHRLVELTPFARAEFDLAYEPTDDPIECARRMLVRAAMGRASSAATNQYKASFRSHTGASRTTNCAQDWGNYAGHIETFSKRLSGVVVENMDSVALMKEHDGEDTLFYVDPPYVAETRDAGADYRHEMDEAQHIALADSLKGLRGMVVLSGYAGELYDRLYVGWRQVQQGSNADGAKARVETLWLSPNISSQR